MADLNNSPGSEGHAIMGGAFIGEFAENTPWVHLDIAGTATTRKEGNLGPSRCNGGNGANLGPISGKIQIDCGIEREYVGFLFFLV